MLIQNFRFEENYAIACDDEWFDLHNDYDLQDFSYQPLSNTCQLTWSRALNHSSKATCSKLILNFKNILLIKISLQESSDNSFDAQTLEFVGFLHPEDVEVMNGCLLQEESDSSFHIIFRFANGFTFKCFSEILTCNLIK